MINKFPSLYKNKITKPIINSLDSEEKILKKTVEDLKNQFFLDDATWGVDYWEKMMGIRKNTLSLKTRKENIKAKMRARGASTLSVIKNICESYSNGEVEINVINDEYRFEIIFVGSIGVPSSFEELDKTINEIKPCHLGHTYRFRYNTHQYLSDYTHEDLSHYNHEEIRILELDKDDTNA